MKRQILLLVISWCCFSCTLEEKVNYETFNDFPIQTKLKSSLIKTPPNLYYVGEMVLLDSVLVTLDLAADTIFRLYKAPSFKYLSGFITKGNDPDQEVMVFPGIKRVDEDEFVFRTINAIKIGRFNHDKDEVEIIEKFYLPAKLMDFFSITLIDSCLLGYDMTRGSDLDFIRYNTSSMVIDKFGPLHPDVSATNFPQLFTKLIDKKQDNSLIVSVFEKFPIVRIYDNKGALMRETRFNNNQEFPQAMLMDNPPQSEIIKMTINYIKLKVTSNYVYALYNGKTLKEMNANDRRIDDYSNEIHVYDWNGNPVRQIILDRNIFSFCVAADDSYIIGSSVNSLDRLFKFNLND